MKMQHESASHRIPLRPDRHSGTADNQGRGTRPLEGRKVSRRQTGLRGLGDGHGSLIRSDKEMRKVINAMMGVG